MEVSQYANQGKPFLGSPNSKVTTVMMQPEASDSQADLLNSNRSKINHDNKIGNASTQTEDGQFKQYKSIYERHGSSNEDLDGDTKIIATERSVTSLVKDGS